MPLFWETEIPNEATALMASAEAGELTPKEFISSLEEIGITGIRSMLFVAKVFDLPLEAAKTLVIEHEYGSTDAWADDILDNIDLDGYRKSDDHSEREREQ